MEKFLVKEPSTLYSALQAFFPDSSKRSLNQWIDQGRIAIDGTPELNKEAPLLPGQEIFLLPKPKLVLSPHNITIVYQDRWVIAIEKPSGLLSCASEDPSEKHAHAALEDHFGALFPLHRLDREASGLLLFARGKVSEKQFDTLFEKRTISRSYFAIVEGRMAKDEGTFESYLAEKENYDVEVSSKDRGKLAITHYRVLHRSKNFTFLHVRLETGRKHQIRVHFSEAGHPILGDNRYHSLFDPIKRLCLHAFKLEFLHPFTKKKMILYSNPPHSFSKIVSESIFQQLIS